MSAQPAPVLMRAHAGGQASPTPPLTVTKAARDLHIDHRILAQPGLSLLACAVLAEVLDLCRVGKCFASDEHLAQRCRSKPRTVRETIAELEAAGYLTREVNYAARHKRLLIPTDLWQNLPEVVADSAGTSGEICQELWRISPRVVADSANINTSLNTEVNTKLNTRSDVAACAAAPPEKKIDLVSELPIPGPEKLRRPASHTRGAARPAFAPPDQAELLAYMQQQRPHNDPAKVERLASKCFHYYQANGWRVGKNPMKDWRAACQTFLADLPKATAENPELATTQAHATPNQPFAAQARPVNGHKPAGNGGAMARLLAELE